MMCSKLKIQIFSFLFHPNNKIIHYSNNIFYFQIQNLQEAAEMVKSRCENLLSENNLITKNKNKKLEKVSLPF